LRWAFAPLAGLVSVSVGLDLRRFSLQLVRTRTPTTQTVQKFVLTAHGSRTRFSLQRCFHPMLVRPRASTAQTVQEFVLTAHSSRTRGAQSEIEPRDNAIEGFAQRAIPASAPVLVTG